MTLQKTDTYIAVAVIILLGVLAGYYLYTMYSCRCVKKEQFALRGALMDSQVADGARAYDFTAAPAACGSVIDVEKPDFVMMTCPQKAMKTTQPMSIKDKIDYNYDGPKTEDLLPDVDISGLSFSNDPAADLFNKTVWHRSTHANLKRNFEGGAAMIRGDLPIVPVKNTWFNTTYDQRDLTPGFIPIIYNANVDREDLVYNMTSA